MAGCERRFFEIGKRLARKGHEVHVFTIQFDASLPKEETVDGMFIHRYTSSKNYCATPSSRPLIDVLKYSFVTSAELSLEDFDVCYSNEWPIFHSICAKPFASPLIQEWCEIWSHSQKILMLQRILKFIGTHHVAVSEFTKLRMVNFLKIRPEKISVIPNGVEYSRFSKGSKNKKWGRIAYVGRLAPHKHVEMIVEAFRQVQEKTTEAELHIVGCGPSLSSIKDRATNLDNCFIHGFLPDDDMLDILRSSSLFILPSEREGSGIAALEAMAAGTPVITTDFPDNATKQMVTEMRGTVVPPKASEIAREALTLLHDESRWHTISRNARSFAKQYDWNGITVNFEEVLKKIVE